MTSSDPNKQVIVTSAGETVRDNDPRVRDELIERRPVHDWKSKAVELLGLSQTVCGGRR